MANRYGITPKELTETLKVKMAAAIKLSELKMTKSKKGDDIDRFTVEGFIKTDGTTVPAHITCEKVVISGVMQSKKNVNNLSFAISKITRESLSTGDYEKKTPEAYLKIVARRQLEIAKLPISQDSINEKYVELVADEAQAKKHYEEYESKYYALIDEYIRNTNEFVDTFQIYDMAMEDNLKNNPALNRKGLYTRYVPKYRTHVKGKEGLVPLPAPTIYVDVPYVKVNDTTPAQRARFANRIGYASNDGKFYALVFDFDITFQKKTKVEAKLHANETELEPSVELSRGNLAQWLTPKSIIMSGSFKFGSGSGSQFGISTHIEMASCTIKRSKKIATESFNSEAYNVDNEVFETNGDFDDEPHQRVIAKPDVVITPSSNPVRDIKDNSIEAQMQLKTQQQYGTANPQGYSGFIAPQMNHMGQMQMTPMGQMQHMQMTPQMGMPHQMGQMQMQQPQMQMPMNMQMQSTPQMQQQFVPPLDVNAMMANIPTN